MFKGICTAALFALFAGPVLAGGVDAPVDEPEAVVISDESDVDGGAGEPDVQITIGTAEEEGEVTPDEVLMTAFATGGPEVQRDYAAPATATPAVSHRQSDTLRAMFCTGESAAQHSVLCASND